MMTMHLQHARRRHLEHAVRRWAPVVCYSTFVGGIVAVLRRFGA